MDRFTLADAKVSDGGRKNCILLTLYPDHGMPEGEDDPTGLPPVIVELDDHSASMLEHAIAAGRKQLWSDLWSTYSGYPPYAVHNHGLNEDDPF